VGNAFSVGVAEAGNQIMVGVGSVVSVGGGISVGRVVFSDTQEIKSRNPIIRKNNGKRRME